MTGLVCGKFAPLHKGHIALIEYAIDRCDNLIVFVCNSAAEQENIKIDLATRVNWVKETFKWCKNITVIGDIFNEPKGLISGSEEKSKTWATYVINKFGKIDKVFSSENYSANFSKWLNAENCVFNIERNLIPISASQIRENPLEYKEYISNAALNYCKNRTMKNTLNLKINSVYLLLDDSTDLIRIKLDEESSFPSMKYDTVLKIECEYDYGEKHCKNVLKIKPTIINIRNKK